MDGSPSQGDMSVAEYTREFEKLLTKCDIQEPEEQTIIRYLGGLEPKYSNVIELQQYSTFDEVCVLAHKVEQQRKRQNKKREFSKPVVRTLAFPKENTNTPLRRTVVHHPCSQPCTHILHTHKKTTSPPNSHYSSRLPKPKSQIALEMFKCQGLGHVEADCPNWKVITLAEWYAMKKDTVEEEKEAQIEPPEQEEEEITVERDEGEILVLRRVLNSQKNENTEQRENIFHSRYTVQGKVCSMIIDGGSCGNVVSVSMIEKLGLQTSIHPHLYNIQWLNSHQG